MMPTGLGADLAKTQTGTSLPGLPAGLGIGQLRAAPGAPQDPNADLTVNASEAQTNSDGVQADLTRARWEDFKRRYRPVEQEVINKLGGDGNDEANRAGAIAARQHEVQARELGAQLAARGTSLTPAQRRAVNRQRGLARSLDVATAENTTRRGVRDRNLNGMGQMIGLGRGIATTASGGLDQAAGMQVQRENTNRQMKDQYQKNMVSGVASGASMGFAVGGPVGAAIGGGIGLLTSL